MSAHLPEDHFESVEHIARELPGVPRLAILDALDAEWRRLRADTAPPIASLVAPAVLRRLRHGDHLCSA